MLRRLCTATLATAMFCGLMTGAASQAGAADGSTWSPRTW